MTTLDNKNYERYKHAIMRDHAQAMFPSVEEVPYLRRLLSELVVDLEQPQAEYIIVSGSAWLSGKESLLYAAQHHQTYHYKSLSVDDYRDWRRLAITRMAAANHVEPEDLTERANLVARLKNYPLPTLKALLPIAANATSVILEALGWPDLQPLARLILSRERFQYAQALTLLRLRDEKTMASFIRMFQRAHVTLDGIHHRTSLFEAIMGWNRDWVHKGVLTDNDMAVRAYALLPLERGFAEVLERYRLFQDLEQQAPRTYKHPYRLQLARQSLKDAYVYLAENAGYADAAALHLAIEEKQALATPQIEQEFSSDNITSSDQSAPQSPDKWLSKLLDTEHPLTCEEVECLLRNWLKVGDEQGREGWGWYLLAREGLEVEHGISKELRKEVEQRAKKLFPPTTSWQADSLAKFGTLTLRMFARNLPAQPKLGAKVAYIIRTLIQIDAPKALPLATQYAELEKVKSDTILGLQQYARDTDEYMRLLAAPAFIREGRTELRLGKGASLQGIRHLPMLEKLELESNKVQSDISELGMLTNLRELYMASWQNVENIQALGKLKQLEILHLANCKKVRDISCLYWLKQLRWLNLSLTSIEDISGFGNMTHLEYLNLNGCRKLRTITALSGLKHLAELDVSWTGIRSLKGFGDLPSLSKLNISKCQYLITLQGLGDISHVHQLELHHTPLLKSLQGLGKLPHLKRLDLTGCQGLQDLRGIESLDNLEWLNLESCRLTSLTGLENLPFLQHVNIQCCEEIQDFIPLGYIPNLRLLLIEGLHDLKHITTLQAFQIEQLILRHCAQLHTLEGIASFAGLKRIQCQDCENLAYVGELRLLANLEQAAFFKCPALADVNELHITGLTLYHI